MTLVLSYIIKKIIYITVSMLFRDGKDFPSGWIEMTSPDLNTWTQKDYKIKKDKHFKDFKGQNIAFAWAVQFE